MVSKSFLNNMREKSSQPLSPESQRLIDEKLTRNTDNKSHLSRQMLQQEETSQAIEKATKALSEENLLLRKNAILHLNVDEIIVIPGRKRHLMPEEYTELKNNLERNPLVTPITVFLREDGKYELISGHNRLQAYIDLDKPTIAAVVQEIEKEQVRSAAFYANLMHPSLPDYEKYIGLKAEMARNEWSYQELAIESGVGKSTISRLFTFDALPDSCHALLEKNPHIIGATTAVEIKSAINAGVSEDRILTQLKRLAKNEISMTRAVEELRKKPNESTTLRSIPVPTIKIPVTFNGVDVCRMVGKPGGINILFPSPEIVKDHVKLQREIANLILETIKKDAEPEQE